MATLPIYSCFHPILKQKTQEITKIDNEIKSIISNMFETMYNTERGVGLSANQIGKNLSIVVIDVSEVEGLESTLPFALINPVIKEYSKEVEIREEGCLSIPVLYDDVERSKNIIVEYTNIENTLIREEASGFLARVMQHEIDHLNGIIFYDRLSAFRKSLAKNKMKRLRKGDYKVAYDMMDADGNHH